MLRLCVGEFEVCGILYVTDYIDLSVTFVIKHGFRL